MSYGHGWPHIECQADYERYKKAFALGTEGFAIVAAKNTEDCHGDNFSWQSCEICNRQLGGNRKTVCMTNPGHGHEVVEVEACGDCVYFAEYGQLDDMTMLDHGLEN